MGLQGWQVQGIRPEVGVVQHEYIPRRRSYLQRLVAVHNQMVPLVQFRIPGHQKNVPSTYTMRDVSNGILKIYVILYIYMYTYTLRLQVVTQESLLKPYGSNPIVT